MKIIYVHHAHRQKGNPAGPDDDITKLGVKDANIVAEIMKTEAEKYKTPIKAIYSSPYLRCAKTAKIVNKKLNLPIIFDKRINEMGRDHGETWVQMQERMHDFLKEIVNKYDDGDAVIVVTSGVNVVSFFDVASHQKPRMVAPLIWVPSCSPLIFNISKKDFGD